MAEGATKGGETADGVTKAKLGWEMAAEPDAYQIQSQNGQHVSYNQEMLNRLTNVHSRNKPCNPEDRPPSVQKILAYICKHSHTNESQDYRQTFSSNLTLTQFKLA